MIWLLQHLVEAFYVLDDYSSLRFLSSNSLKSNLVFTPRKALQYSPIRSGSSSQGSNTYYAKNPDYGAIFTFYLSDEVSTKKQKRKKIEKELEKSNSNIPFPGWDELDAELNQNLPKVIIEIYDDNNNFVDRFSTAYKKGFNRISWDLTKNISTNVSSGSTRSYSPSVRVSPGKYSFNVYLSFDGKVNKIGSKFFEVERIRSGVLNNPNIDKIDEYVTEIENEYKNYSVLSSKFGKIKDDNKSIISLINKSSNYKDYISQQNAIQKSINQIDVFISGNKSKKDVREKDVETISNRLSVATRGINSSYGPTGMQISSLTKAKSLIIKLGEMIDNLNLEFTKLKNQVESELDAYILD